MPLILMVGEQYSIGQTTFTFPLVFCKYDFSLFLPQEFNNCIVFNAQKTWICLGYE